MTTLKVVQADYGCGWEDVSASEDIKEARRDLADYRKNDSYAKKIRLNTRREKKVKNDSKN